VVDQKPNLILLGGDNPTTWIIYNRLVHEFGPFPAVIERHVSRLAMLRNRFRKLGLGPVLSQVGFVILIRPFLNYFGKRRISQICRRDGLERTEPFSNRIIRVASANGAVCQNFLTGLQPKVIIVNGTRILRSNILRATDAVFINTHQGITPLYRGAHGAYWSLFQKDSGHCGVTVHLVDEGIDTGQIISQEKIAPRADDSFVTYPYLQTAAALPLLLEATRDALAGTLKTTAIHGPSRVWYHPGFFSYLSGRLRGIR
jgi:phosphoribosylglycinamide formyltransferase-1